MERVLGVGGMGIVYEVRKMPAGIRGAMKVMHPARGAGFDTLVAEFLAEARLLACIRHPNIVAVMDFETLDEGTPYIVMELLEGQSLREVLRSLADAASRLPAQSIYDIFNQLCEGLRVLHTQAPVVVHRDVKPENVFLHRISNTAGDGVVKLLDFGLAGAVSGAERDARGTPRYMPPEQVLGGPVSARSDQYSAALVLYEMMTGRVPWNVDVQNVEEMARAHISRAPLPPSYFCPWATEQIDRIMLRALEKHPDKRWSTIMQFCDELRVLRSINDGSAYWNADVNRTEETLGTLAMRTALRAAAAEVSAPSRTGVDPAYEQTTDEGMPTPPVEGRSLEVLPWVHRVDPAWAETRKDDLAQAVVPVVDGALASPVAAQERGALILLASNRAAGVGDPRGAVRTDVPGPRVEEGRGRHRQSSAHLRRPLRALGLASLVAATILCVDAKTKLISAESRSAAPGLIPRTVDLPSVIGTDNPVPFSEPRGPAPTGGAALSVQGSTDSASRPLAIKTRNARVPNRHVEPVPAGAASALLPDRSVGHALPLPSSAPSSTSDPGEGLTEFYVRM